MLARMGEAHALQPDEPTSQEQHELKELQVAHTALVKNRTRLLNRLKTQTVALVRKLTKGRLTQIERQLAKIETEIRTRLQTTPEAARAHDILRSIPGLGEVSAAAILIECPEIGTLGRKQIASLAGLPPSRANEGNGEATPSSRQHASSCEMHCTCLPLSRPGSTRI
ncbi:MAG: transposase [Paracoccaceae bacterium]